jgi:lysophospholipase L1-like esterase
MNGLALSLAFAPVAPLMLWQGRRVRRVTPVLPAAAGPIAGHANTPAGRGKPLRLLVFGESTAAGVGATTHADALTGHLARELARRTGRPVDWEVFGLSGATVASAHASLMPAVASGPRDLMVLVFGVNDTLEHTRAVRFVADLGALLGALRAQAGPAPALITAPPPMARFPALPHPLAAYLGARAALLRRALARAKLEDAQPVETRVRIAPEMFAPDGFHPSPRGYAVWAESLADAALARLP